MADPLHDSEQAVTIRNVFGSEVYVDDVNTPVLPNDSTILALQTSPAGQSEPALLR